MSVVFTGVSPVPHTEIDIGQAVNHSPNTWNEYLSAEL